MKMLTTSEMQACDQRTAKGGVPLEALMENAGAAVSRCILRRYAKAERLVLLCGKGNNGGDGLVAARHLAADGKRVRVVLLGEPEQLKGEAAGAFLALQAEKRVKVTVVRDEKQLAGEARRVADADVLVDAVLGTGFKAPLRGLAAAAVRLLRAARVPVVAVDLPTGWDADATTENCAGSYRADAVVTFTAPKPAHLFGHVGAAVAVAEIGSPETAVRSAEKMGWTGTAKALTETRRDVSSHKGEFGHVLVMGGSRGKAGAAAMVAMAAMRAGAGLVTAAVPDGVLNTVARFAPEMMTAALMESKEGAVSAENLRAKHLTALLKGKSVVAVGPGLGTSAGTVEFVRRLMREVRVPMVVDADGLNALAGHTKILNGRGRVLVVTPHPGEMARLLGVSVREVEADRVGAAREFAKRHKVTVVLKGWRTLVAHPDGRVAVNTSGCAAMAKGGSGDVLTGLIAALVAQYPKHAGEAVEAAVYLHGLAAEMAVRGRDERTLLATDALGSLSEAFRYRVKDEDGLRWIAGGVR